LLGLLANGVDRDDPPILHEEPQYARVEFADVAGFGKAVTNGPGQRFPVILSVSQFRETSDDRHEVVWIARFNSSKNSRTGRFPVSVS